MVFPTETPSFSPFAWCWRVYYKRTRLWLMVRRCHLLITRIWMFTAAGKVVVSLTPSSLEWGQKKNYLWYAAQIRQLIWNKVAWKPGNLWRSQHISFMYGIKCKHSASTLDHYVGRAFTFRRWNKAKHKMWKSSTRDKVSDRQRKTFQQVLQTHFSSKWGRLYTVKKRDTLKRIIFQDQLHDLTSVLKF